MSLQNHSLFSNIFEETHKELVSLISAFNQISIVYKPQENLEIDNDSSELVNNFLSINNSELEDDLLLIDSNDDLKFDFDSVLSKTKIEIYRQIYMKQPFEDEKKDELDSNKVLKKQLDSQEEEAYLHRLSTNKCCTTELDIFLLAMMEALIRTPEQTTKGNSKTLHTTLYQFEGIKICQKAFFLIFGIGKKKWDNMREHYNKFGLVQVVHKLKNRTSNFAISFQSVLNALTFITNYANIHGLPSPGRHLRDDTKHIIFLPTNESYSSLYRLYIDSIEESSDYYISNSSFYRIWKKYVPEFKFLTPRSDLCDLCKEMRFSSKYWPESEIENKIKQWNYHFEWAQRERAFYR
ncbi:26330_t:CDS:2 [Gigaspora margarita]|uniref:26330_t:CDS:1 n=1 Tax=Gigaspora margarita TaxID=4874 RepID=A0ABM8W4K6_GIGMA|nr:26330_t:CDS:2 [Gigaspora margarita]